MNVKTAWSAPRRFIFTMSMKIRKFDLKRKCCAFGFSNSKSTSAIEHVYVINLDRQPGRWADIENELTRVRDSFGNKILNLTDRFPAIDSTQFLQDAIKDADVDPDIH